MDEITPDEVTEYWDDILDGDTTPMGDNAIESMKELNKDCVDN